ncbi:MAG TPA: hypothetical protein VKK79_00195 [Candidatus Lokiarchaeia archaeon]|nr:hypothetical protein [Candidatus Lokiarchaeia archaeon]
MRFKRIGNDDTKTKKQAKYGDNNTGTPKDIRVDIIEPPADTPKPAVEANIPLAETRITVLICR